MSARDIPLLVMPFMEKLLPMGQWATKYGEGVALVGPFSWTLSEYKLAGHDISAPLVYTLKSRPLVLIW